MPTTQEPTTKNDCLDRLYDQHGVQVFRYLLAILGRVEDAEDVLQTVWMKLVRTSRPAVEAGYLWRAARNEALRFTGRKRDHGRRQLGLEALEIFPDQGHPDVSRDERIAVVSALAEVPFEQREAVVLMAFLGYTAGEAAQRIGAPENTVASRYRLGVAKLKHLLDRT